MADVSKIKVPGDSTIYNLKDAGAARYFEFDPNLVTPSETNINVKNSDGQEIDNHWMLGYQDGSDLVLKDLSYGGIEVIRIPLYYAKYIDFEPENGAPNNFYLNVKDTVGNLLSQTHCFINNRGGTFVFGYEDSQGVWHDIASC